MEWRIYILYVFFFSFRFFDLFFDKGLFFKKRKDTRYIFVRTGTFKRGKYSYKKLEYIREEFGCNRKDLCDTAFGGTVSDIHAVLNYVEGLWYIEDMQSKNGTQIKGFLEDKLYNIRDGQSRLVKNDYIFIGLNKLQIR